MSVEYQSTLVNSLIMVLKNQRNISSKKKYNEIFIKLHTLVLYQSQHSSRASCSFKASLLSCASGCCSNLTVACHVQQQFQKPPLALVSWQRRHVVGWKLLEDNEGVEAMQCQIFPSPLFQTAQLLFSLWMYGSKMVSVGLRSPIGDQAAYCVTKFYCRLADLPFTTACSTASLSWLHAETWWKQN